MKAICGLRFESPPKNSLQLKKKEIINSYLLSFPRAHVGGSLARRPVSVGALLHALLKCVLDLRTDGEDQWTETRVEETTWPYRKEC